MSKNTVAKIVPKGKPQPPKPQPESMPTRMEHAERTTIFVDYTNADDKDPLRVVVAAQKTARALHLAIEGLYVETEHTTLDSEDIDLLSEMAVGVLLCCDQAKKLVAEGQVAAAPARAA